MSSPNRVDLVWERVNENDRKSGSVDRVHVQTTPISRRSQESLPDLLAGGVEVTRSHGIPEEVGRGLLIADGWLLGFERYGGLVITCFRTLIKAFAREISTVRGHAIFWPLDHPSKLELSRSVQPMLRTLKGGTPLERCNEQDEAIFWEWDGSGCAGLNVSSKTRKTMALTTYPVVCELTTGFGCKTAFLEVCGLRVLAGSHINELRVGYVMILWEREGESAANQRCPALVTTRAGSRRIRHPGYAVLGIPMHCQDVFMDIQEIGKRLLGNGTYAGGTESIESSYLQISAALGSGLRMTWTPLIPFKTVRSGSFENGDIVWFPEGGLNASYNCVDRWAYTHPDKTAIIYEADEPGEG
ncbi:hypothetical protein BJ322DRAFT_1019205 [Thelephora terrestris]|uniref:Uncharacterized protein n=1 Tax=Thelephora terrestris TaxID=56493 RepID=A0A9P6HKC4_9AGAM|nr:hypothetical protein BJ322DRAFT_1019205 [Thelephora terrestris]